MQENKYSIKEWAKDDQPREKLLSFGAKILSTTELLAILLQSGTRKCSAVDLARQILALVNNNLDELGRLSVKDLMKIEGIGHARAISVLAALELGRRRHTGVFRTKTAIHSSNDIAFHLQTLLKDYRHEVFAVLFLNQSNRLIHFEVISEGGLTGTVADPRIIIKKALEHDAVGIILCHNHPSGSLRPSRSDQHLTRKIRESAALLDIRLIDHLIVSDEGYYSFADHELI
ncbi:MAG: DNA repair protein RadC [Chitinophagaceae bacterium]